MLTTQPNKFYLQRLSFLVVLWAFAAYVLSNWWKCFLNLQVFFLFEARWALSATVEIASYDPFNGSVLNKSINLFKKTYWSKTFEQ